MNQDFVDLLRAFSEAEFHFEDAWATRERGAFGDLAVDFIGRDAFILNKRETGRTKDLGDIEGL